MRPRQRVQPRRDKPAEQQPLPEQKPADFRSENYTYVSAWTLRPLFKPEDTQRPTGDVGAPSPIRKIKAR